MVDHETPAQEQLCQGRAVIAGLGLGGAMWHKRTRYVRLWLVPCSCHNFSQDIDDKSAASLGLGLVVPGLYPHSTQRNSPTSPTSLRYRPDR